MGDLGSICLSCRVPELMAITLYCREWAPSDVLLLALEIKLYSPICMQLSRHILKGMARQACTWGKNHSLWILK